MRICSECLCDFGGPHDADCSHHPKNQTAATPAAPVVPAPVVIQVTLGVLLNACATKASQLGEGALAYEQYLRVFQPLFAAYEHDSLAPAPVATAQDVTAALRAEAIEVIRFARTNEPHDDWNDWQNAILNGLLRAYNMGVDSQTPPPQPTGTPPQDWYNGALVEHTAYCTDCTFTEKCSRYKHLKARLYAPPPTGTPEPLRDELMQALTQWQIDERSGYDILASASLDRVRAALAAEQRKG